MLAPEDSLPLLLGLAVLFPLVSFVVIFLFGNRLERLGAYVATGAIAGAAMCSITAGAIWLAQHSPPAAHHASQAESHAAVASPQVQLTALHEGHDHPHDERRPHPVEAHFMPPVYTGHWYSLGRFYGSEIAINYYIDALTIVMFCVVTFIATCIHFYAGGYMHEELHEVTDHEVTLADGEHLKRPGRYHRFFQYLSLFCFSMLGLVVSGNIAMTFVFWELVGVCSYFLIGFYVERRSASTAANKAFIVNRVGDFGMLIGLMAIWASLATFNFGDVDRNGDGKIETSEAGLFSLLRPAGDDGLHALHVPDGMVLQGAKSKVEALIAAAKPGTTTDALRSEIMAQVPLWRDGKAEGDATRYGYWLLVVAGIGIFCGCVGKSAQFPLHVWLPDAMEGPTPVSALVHSATMVAAGVFLVARFYPVFAPEVLFVIACIGCITLLVGGSIAIVATDIKRVLAYSTVSQLGYMMLALGVGGWTAGVMHLVTHAFFKSLLFLCSGSVIHAVHTNEMTQMGGLRKKMPYTAYTMLVGCLAIAGVGVPSALGIPFGFSGYYSKDMMLEQAYLFRSANPIWGSIFFYAAASGAAVTAFYMFRMWYLTFAGEPRDEHRYDHAHESPKVMYAPLIVLAVMAITIGWPIFGNYGLVNLIEQARPVGLWSDMASLDGGYVWLHESKSHADEIRTPVGLMAFGAALAGIFLASVMYLWRTLNKDDARRTFAPVYKFLVHKWWFDETYDLLFVRPAKGIAACVSWFDQQCIDRFLNGLAWSVRQIARVGEVWVDQAAIDGAVNWLAAKTYRTGSSLRGMQTGSLRQYVMFIVVGTLALFVLVSFWSYGFAR